MAFRGRGRGRGFGVRPNYANQKSVPLFPDDVELPDPRYVQGDSTLLSWHGKLAVYWRSSPYLMEEKATEKKELVDIETYLHRATKSKRKWTKESASAFLKLEPGYFPLELVEGVKSRVNKKVRWKQNQDEDLEAIFQKHLKGQSKDKDVKVMKESDDEDEEKEEEEDGSDASSAGDYSQNEDFDDDEDDFNDDDGGADEGDTY